MFNTIRKSKTTKGLVGLLSPLLLASGIYFSTPRFSHANPVSDFIEEKIDQLLDDVVKGMTGKTYNEAIKDITPEKEQTKEPTGILYLRDGSTIKNVKYKDKEFTFTKDGQKLKVPKEKILVIDFSKEKNKDMLYLRDGSTIKNVQYQPKNLEIQSYLGDIEIDQDKIKVLIFGKQQKTTEEKTTPKKEEPKSVKEVPRPEPRHSETLEYRVVKTEKLTNGFVISPLWSPDGKKIVFSSDRDGNEEIYVMNTDGTNLKRLTNNPAMDIASSWSPDSKKILFESNRDGNFEIYSMDVNGTNVQRLTNNPAYDGKASWSPDGKKIAFVSEKDGNHGMHIMNHDGTNVQRLNNNSFDGRASWSINSKKIIFASCKGKNNFGIYVMDTNSNNTNVKRITTITYDPGKPISSIALSPDGKKIAFESYKDENNEIYIINIDGTNVQRLTNNESYDTSPSWSPDGKKILFVSKRDGNPGMYIMYLDTAAETPRQSTEIRKPVLTKEDVISLFEKKINENENKYDILRDYIKFEQGKFTESQEPEAIVSFLDNNQCHANGADELWLLKYKNGKWEIDRKLAENDSIEFKTVDIQRDGKLEILIRSGGGNQGYFVHTNKLISINGKTITVLYSNEGWNNVGAGREGEAVKEYTVEFKDVDGDFKTLEIVETEKTETYAWRGDKSNNKNYKKISDKTKETTYKLKDGKYVNIKNVTGKSATTQLNKGTVNELETMIQMEYALKNNKYVAINMSCPWGPCKDYDPIFEELAKEYEDISFCEIIQGKPGKDRKEDEKINDKYKINGLPTIILFKDGKEVYRQAGPSTLRKDGNKQVIEDYLKKK